MNFPVEDFDPSNYLAPRVSSSDDDKQSVTCVCQSETSAVVENVPNGDIPNHRENQTHGGKEFLSLLTVSLSLSLQKKEIKKNENRYLIFCLYVNFFF